VHSWRSHIGYVPQESAMMAGTIRENLCYGFSNWWDIPDERVWEVTEMAYAKKCIENFPDGLDTEVGERGSKCSGSQKLRRASARAVLRPPTTLMRDEARASLDSQSERVVQRALNRLMKGRTTFAIAHRLSTIVDADKIVFIENGRVTGIGSHETLLSTHELYASFSKQQLV